MAPCARLTVEECMAKIKLNTTALNFTQDAEILCYSKQNSWTEIFSSAAVAIVIYLVTNVYIQIAECSFTLKKSRIWGEGKPHYEEGKKAIVRSAIVNCTIGLALYVGTSIMVHILSDPLDNRANKIVNGFSHFFAGVLFLKMSVQIPQWFGIYHSNKNTNISFTSGKEIRFNLSWNLWKLFLNMFFFNLYFSSADIGHWGALIGLITSVLVIYITMLARSPKYKKYKRALCIAMVILFGLGSWLTAFNGITYIFDVWTPSDNEDELLVDAFGYSIIWVIIIICCHIILHYWTRDKQSKGKSMRFISQLFITNNSTPLSKDKNIKEVEDEDDEEEGNNDNDNEKQEVVANPPPPAPSASDKEGQEENEDDEKQSRHIAFDVEGRGDDNDDDDDDNNNNKNGHTSVLRPGLNKNGDNRALYVDPNDAPSYWGLFMTQLVDAFPFLCGCCLKEKYHVDNISRRRLDYVTEGQQKTCAEKIGDGIKRFLWYFLSLFFFFSTIVNIKASYEQCAAKNQLPSTFEQLYPSDFITGTMCAWEKNADGLKPGPNSTIKQFDTVQEVQDANYEIIHCGACGACSNWNDIQLQYTTRKVLAGITKVCARKSIGKVFNESDDNDPVIQCNYKQVGFTMPCAKAWAWDEINTKNHAIFTFLQAQLANSFADMEVSFQDITMATIDEALSGPTFVPEVGATRRRMNIVSDIRRPPYQQCNIIKQNWTEVFNDTFYPPVGGVYVIQAPNKPSETIVVVGQDSF